MKQTYEDAVLKCVLWWSDKSFRTPLNQNNGDDSPQGSMAFARMNMVALSAQQKVTDEKIKKFEDKLIELLLQAKTRYEKTLSVDYGPCTLLAEAADFAELEYACFPCKTHSFIEDNNEVYVKYQYGGELVKL